MLLYIYGMNKLQPKQIAIFLKQLPFVDQDLLVQYRKRETPEAYSLQNDFVVQSMGFDFKKVTTSVVHQAFVDFINECVTESGGGFKTFSVKGDLRLPQSIWYCLQQKWNEYKKTDTYQEFVQKDIENRPIPTLNLTLSDEFAINKNIESYLNYYDSVIKLPKLSNEEYEFLKKYSGYGGLGNKGIVTKEIAKGLLTEYYTPQPIIDIMWALAYKYGYQKGNVLEPSAGIGKFVWNKDNYTQATCIETNKYSSLICKIITYIEEAYVSCRNEYFEQLFIERNESVKNNYFEAKESFDLVIGNPPYGEVSGPYMALGEKKYTQASNLVDYFIFRGLDCLKKGGLLIYIIGVEPQNGGTPYLDKENDVCKLATAAKCEIVEAFRLPKGSIPRTEVVCDIIVLRKL
jgi:hypothetical protein